jgi:hypothetical protein
LTRESLVKILARSETRFLDPIFSQDFREIRESKLVARLASPESHRQNFIARIAKSESCYDLQMRDSQIPRLASLTIYTFFPSCETHETRETCTDIFARSESHFLQNSREKNCETRLAVNPNSSANSSFAGP